MYKTYDIQLKIGDGIVKYSVMIETCNLQNGFAKIEALLEAINTNNVTIEVSSEDETRIYKGRY